MNETPLTLEQQNEQTGCALCGNKRSKKRELYYYGGQDKFDDNYKPRLTYDERYVLQSGFNSICENRSACRAYYRKHRLSPDPINTNAMSRKQ